MPTYQQKTSRRLRNSENLDSRRNTSREKTGGIVQKTTSAVLLIVTVLVCILSLGGPSGLLELRAIESDVAQLTRKNQELDREILEFNNRIYGIRENEFILEKTAREELGFAKPGEVVYVFPDEIDKSKQARNTASTIQTSSLDSASADLPFCTGNAPTSSGCQNPSQSQLGASAMRDGIKSPSHLPANK